jgi:hypothetical protein
VFLFFTYQIRTTVPAVKVTPDIWAMNMHEVETKTQEPSLLMVAANGTTKRVIRRSILLTFSRQSNVSGIAMALKEKKIN